MKFSSLLLICIICWSSFSCKSGDGKNDSSTYSGTIEATGITSYQYGTHTLETENSFYALRSKQVDLARYEGENVTIRAVKIEGYPVDGGPEYLEVLSVEE